MSERHEYKDGKLTISLCEIIAEILSDEEREELLSDALRSISFDDAVAKAVIKRLAGDDYDWWSGTDAELRHEALCKMESELISGYKWYWLNWLREAVKGIYNDKRLFWMLYHDEEVGTWFYGWCRKHNIESSFCEDKEADLAKIIEHFNTAIENLKAGIPLPKPNVEGVRE